MAEERKPVRISDEEIENITGGTTREYRAAWDVINGCYGGGSQCYNNLWAAGLNADTVMYLANGISSGYLAVANDILNNKYGVGQERMNNLAAAGFDPNLAQALVNGMLMNS